MKEKFEEFQLDRWDRVEATIELLDEVLLNVEHRLKKLENNQKRLEARLNLIEDLMRDAQEDATWSTI